MIELTQTSLHPSGNCWQTCIACILELDPETLPPQKEYDKVSTNEKGETVYGPMYNVALRAYLRKHHNLTYIEPHVPEEALQILKVEGYHMITGKTVRSDAQNGVRHVVVAKDGKMVWDPHPSRAGLSEDLRWGLLIPWPKNWHYSADTPCECPGCKNGG